MKCITNLYGINDPYSKIIHDQVNMPLEVYTGVANLLSANVGSWPAEVMLSQWDFIFLPFLLSPQVKFPVKYKIMLPTEISDGCGNIPSMNWALSPTAAHCQLLVCTLTVVSCHTGKIHLLGFP